MCLVALACLCLVPSVDARTPDDWDRVQALEAGTRLIVTTGAGVHLEGLLREASEDEVVLVTKLGGERRIVAADVRAVRMLQRDPVLNGVLAGAAIGLASGASLGAGWVHGSGRYGAKPPGYAAGFISGTAVLGAVVGAVVGWRQDARRMRAVVVHEKRRIP